MLARLSFLCCSVLALACGTVSIDDGDLDAIDQDLGTVRTCDSFKTPQACNARASRCGWVGKGCPEPLPPGATSCADFGKCANLIVVKDAGTGDGETKPADAGTPTLVCPAGSVAVTQTGLPVIAIYPAPVIVPTCVKYNLACTAVSVCSCLPKSLGTCASNKAGGCTCDNIVR